MTAELTQWLAKRHSGCEFITLQPVDNGKGISSSGDIDIQGQGACYLHRGKQSEIDGAEQKQTWCRDNVLE